MALIDSGISSLPVACAKVKLRGFGFGKGSRPVACAKVRDLLLAPARDFLKGEDVGDGRLIRGIVY